MLEFNRLNFLLLTILSHCALAFVLVCGSWAQIVAMFGAFVVITLLASTVTYHRLLSHRSWKAPRWFEVFGTLLGVFSFTGTPITRTVIHRVHHAHADTPRDPHAPSHLGVWLTYFPMFQKDVDLPLRLVSDLLRDRFHRDVHKYYFVIIATTVVIAAAVLGWSWALALTVAPGALCWMNISICNTLCHMGPTGDRIRNSPWLAALTFGEGWHKHHHETPTDPRFGPWDPGYLVIRLVERLAHHEASA